MSRFEINQLQNRLIIQYTGVVVAADTEKGLEQIRLGLAQLQPGLKLLVDLSELESMAPECAPSIEKAMDLCNGKGTAMVVRIIPDPHRDIGLQIMSIFHYGGDVRIITCQTRAEAEEILGS